GDDDDDIFGVLHGGERNRRPQAGAVGCRTAVKIYTKRGGGGDAGLFGGERVPKDDARVEAYGQVDELNATLGVAIVQVPEGFERALFETIQRDLFTIGAELASPDPAKVDKA